jgi:hypothetical protein
MVTVTFPIVDEYIVCFDTASSSSLKKKQEATIEFRTDSDVSTWSSTPIETKPTTTATTNHSSFHFVCFDHVRLKVKDVKSKPGWSLGRL